MEVRRCDAAEVSTLETFFAAASEPLVVRGLDVGVEGLGFGDVARGVAGDTIRVWSWDVDGYVDAPAADLVTRVLAGDPQWNAVDHPVGDAPLGARMRTPFFAERNWLADIPAFADFQLQCQVSPAGAYTQLHNDGCPSGWVYVIEGEKRWNLYGPDVRPLFYDVNFGTWHRPTIPVEPVEAVLGPGDLLFVPSAWVHEVWTPSATLAVGGSFLNRWQIVEGTAWWLTEHAAGCGGRLDLTAELDARLPGDERLAVARSLIDRWSAHRGRLPQSKPMLAKQAR
jgi:hypothetical protein